MTTTQTPTTQTPDLDSPAPLLTREQATSTLHYLRTKHGWGFFEDHDHTITQISHAIDATLPSVDLATVTTEQAALAWQEGTPVLPAQITDVTENLKRLKRDVSNAERRLSDLRQSLADTEHADRLRAEYLYDGAPEEVHNLVYSAAYSAGHACGESEIENQYIDLAELAAKIVKAVTA